MKTRYILVCLLIPAALAWGQTGYSARSLGMAGAYQGMARGPEVSNWNPANLGLSDAGANFRLDLLNVGATLGNNSVNLNLYNSYFTEESDTWDDAAKADILSRIPSDGLSEFNRVHATVLGISYKQYALAINGFAYSDVKVPKEFIALPLNGLNAGRVDLDNAEGEGVVGTEIALSYAHPFNLGLPIVKEFSAGVTAKYLLGQVYAKADHASGYIDIDTSITNMHVDLQGSYEATLGGYPADDGSMGSGLGLDLGAAARLSDHLAVGFSLNNFIGSIKFKNVQKETGSISLYETGIDPDQFDNFDAYLDSITTTTDTSFTSGSATYKMPKTMTFSATYNILKWMTVEADYQQGLNKTAGNSTKPRMALGTEIRYLKVLPLRLGLAFGGVQGTTLACGLGLDLKVYQLDLAIANQQGLFNSSKGISLALSQRILF
jgi:hypothetical protein